MGLFTAAPDHGKLAVAGRWEDAIGFLPGEPPAGSFGDEVACEAFFGQAFFGVRRRGTAEELTEFVRSFAEAMQGPGFFRRLEEMGIPLRQRFLYAEIGAEGAWNSIGAYRVPDPDVALLEFEELWEDLKESAVYEDRAHEKALEYVYDNGDGTTHWYAVPLSKDRRLLYAKLVSALGSWETSALDRYRS